jgi:hypothetical protein
MNLSFPENPLARDPAFAIAPATARCADLPRALMGATPEEVDEAAASVASQLKAIGWQSISDVPGLRAYTKNGRMLALDQLLAMFAAGYMSAANWEATCAVDGISELQVQLPGAASVRVAAATPPAEGFVDPFPPAEQVAGHGGFLPPAERSRSKRFGLIALAIVAFVFVAWAQVQRSSDFNDHLEGHIRGDTEVEVAYDGKLTLDGGRATVVYPVVAHEFETTDEPPPGPKYPNTKAMEMNSVNWWGGSGRNFIDLTHLSRRDDLGKPADLETWINVNNVDASVEADAVVTAKRASLDGHTAYIWEWTCTTGCWNYFARVPIGHDIYSVRCRLMPSLITPENQARCKQFASGLKISRVPA